MVVEGIYSPLAIETDVMMICWLCTPLKAALGARAWAEGSRTGANEVEDHVTW